MEEPFLIKTYISPYPSNTSKYTFFDKVHDFYRDHIEMPLLLFGMAICFSFSIINFTDPRFINELIKLIMQGISK